MVRFILELIIFILLAFIVYLVSLSLPRISEEEIEKIRLKRKEKLLVFIEKGDLVLKYFLEKILRKMKVWLLSLNNFIENKLSKFKKEAIKIESETTSNSLLEKKEEDNA